MPEPHDHLRELMRGDPERVAFLVGPQVARQAVAGSPVEPFATREGLIRSGLERAVAAGRLPARPTDLPTSHRGDAIGAAARDVERALLDPPDELAHRWLRDTVGAFIHHVRRPRVLEPLAELPRLGVKLVTTNHDLLLEELTGLPPSTWRDEAGTQARDRAILHLHGVWHRPESVVLGALPTDIHRHVEAIQALVAAKRWIVCVGYDGEHRSILGGFLRWLVLTASPDVRFFHLCTYSEARPLLDQYLDDRGGSRSPTAARRTTSRRSSAPWSRRSRRWRRTITRHRTPAACPPCRSPTC